MTTTTASATTFEQLGVAPWLVATLRELGIERPSPVQAACVPEILSARRRLVVGCARTGSGKTAAYAVPVLQHLAAEMHAPYAVVLAPTRELALQVAEQFRVFGGGISARECVVVGGGDMQAQAASLARRPHIVIATPGRLADVIRSCPGTADFSHARYLVLDEADRLLDASFADDLETIISLFPPPEKRQTLFFSATITPTFEATMRSAASATQGEKDSSVTKKSTKNHLFVFRENDQEEGTEAEASVQAPKQLLAASEKLLELSYLLVPRAVKEAYLVWLMRNDFANKSVIVFTSRCRVCALVHRLLNIFGVKALAMHSYMTQAQRKIALGEFKSSRTRCLVSTDVAARGLDLPGVAVVLNYDVPNCASDFVHRVGRTARAGRAGFALTFVGEHDVDLVHNIEAKTSRKLKDYSFDEGKLLEDTFLQDVNIAKREAIMYLERTEFGQRQDINKHKIQQTPSLPLHSANSRLKSIKKEKKKTTQEKI